MHDLEVKSKVANMVGRSNDRASVKNSNAIHACAVNMIPEYVDLLLEFAPDAERLSVLNKRNLAGLTPLMVVAATSPSNPNSCSQIVEKLIHLGADKGLTDASCETALGKFRGMKQSMTDFRNMIGFQRNSAEMNWEREHARMEQLLRMPIWRVATTMMMTTTRTMATTMMMMTTTMTMPLNLRVTETKTKWARKSRCDGQ
jgi:hypothetical protein